MIIKFQVQLESLPGWQLPFLPEENYVKPVTFDPLNDHNLIALVTMRV